MCSNILREDYGLLFRTSEQEIVIRSSKEQQRSISDLDMSYMYLDL